MIRLPSNGRLFRTAAVALALGLAGSAPAAAQIPETFDNLQVLDPDISRGELVGIMRSFAGGLGVRCNFCHLGEDPNDLTGYDWASDEREVKGVARRMMQMVTDINEEHLPAAGRGSGIEVACVTCHSGVRIPVQIGDLLLETLERDGIESALSEYRELRGEYYGRAAYDFGQGPLNTVSETLARRGELDHALAVIQVNVEYHADEPFPHALKAQILMQMGDTEGAVAAMERAVELAPESEQFRAMLERMRGGGGARGAPDGRHDS